MTAPQGFDLSTNLAPERRAMLRLARSRNVGPRSFQRLMSIYGSAVAALSALPELARRGGDAAYRICPEADSDRELAAAEAVGASLLCLGDPFYPRPLAEIADPPPVLWARGDLRLLSRSGVAIVGARNSSAMGQVFAGTIARDVGQAGFVIVSGLARGIDAAAHEAALACGTIAVVAGGVDKIYPPENAALTAQIIASGLVLSEAPMGHVAIAHDFPRRNRIIAGLSRAVVLIEAAARSGSLTTARFALEQGREVMCAPGGPLDPRSSGCNALIRDGALLVTKAADVLEALDPPMIARRWAEPVHIPQYRTPPPRGDIERQLLELLSAGPTSVDALVERCGAPVAEVTLGLVELKLAGRLDESEHGAVRLAPAPELRL